MAIFTFTTAFNLMGAFSLIIYENFNNDEFNNWFKKNTIVASIFTLLSSTNIETLNILCSKFAGLDLFSTKFLERSELTVFWFSVINFIAEDIPQFGIQVNYYYLINS